MTRNSITRKSIALSVIVALSLGIVAAGPAGAASGPVVEQGPEEFTALWSEDGHVEVVFEGAIDPSEYDFTIVNATGVAVADDTDMNGQMTNGSQGRVIFDLGDTDLTDGSVLTITGDGVDMELPITTTSSFVQEGKPSHGELHQGETLALVDLWEPNAPYEIWRDGELVASGTLGEDSYVGTIDTTGWTTNATYTVEFRDQAATRTFTVLPPIEDSSDEPSTAGQRTQSVEQTSVLEVHDVVIANETVQVGEPVTVTATFENVGTASGDFVAWLGNGDLDVKDEMRVTDLGAGATRPVSLEATFDRRGSYTLVLSGRTIGEVTVHNPDAAGDRGPEPHPEARQLFNERYPNLDFDVWRGIIDLEVFVSESS